MRFPASKETSDGSWTKAVHATPLGIPGYSSVCNVPELDAGDLYAAWDEYARDQQEEYDRWIAYLERYESYQAEDTAETLWLGKWG